MHPQLEAFVEVVRRGSVTGAARALYVTQPALTARLNTLERDVGAPLLVRRRGGVRLTEAGRTFLPYAERALQAVADGRVVLTELRRGAAGYVSICASPIVSTYALPTILNRFSQTHPGVPVAVRTGHSEEMIELVKRDQGSVGLLRAFDDPDVEQPRGPVGAVRRKAAGGAMGATAAFLELLREMRGDLQAAASATA